MIPDTRNSRHRRTEVNLAVTSETIPWNNHFPEEKSGKRFCLVMAKGPYLSPGVTLNYLSTTSSAAILNVYEIHCHLWMPRDQTNFYILLILAGRLKMQKAMAEARIHHWYNERMMVPGDVLVSGFNSFFFFTF